MAIFVTKLIDGGFSFSSDPITGNEARMIDEALNESFDIVRKVQEVKAPKVDPSELDTFYGDA